MTFNLTPLVLTQKSPDLRYVESIKGILLIANIGGLSSELFEVLTEAGLNPLMEDYGEILITYEDLMKIYNFSTAFTKWAEDNKLLVEYDCDH
jgi:hypothetical protein